MSRTASELTADFYRKKHHAQGVNFMFNSKVSGIKKEDYDQAIKPFIRLDTSRNQNIPGSGLGLSISQDITSNHGGKMSMSESSLGGLKVSLNFPK